MPGVSKEQIAKAKEWDLLSYLQAYNPGELKKTSGREYRTVSHDSLVISNGKWCWNSQGIGGKTALDYLIKVQGIPFVEAVEILCGERGAVEQKSPLLPQKPEPPKPFILPPVNRYGTAAVSYLQGRGISVDIINQCIENGLLYESRKCHNCVFVGYDPKGKARFACLRGTYGSFRMDVDGSDKRYGFCLPASSTDSALLAVAESPIDALSLATIELMKGNDWARCHYLSLAGTAPNALLQFLHDHPQVRHISLCLDNDKGGLTGIKKICEAIAADPALSKRGIQLDATPPPTAYGKDYNDFLKACLVQQRQKQARSRQPEAR